jgi:hypothetical protein
VRQGQGVFSRGRGVAAGLLQEHLGRQPLSGLRPPILLRPLQGPICHGPGLGDRSFLIPAAAKEKIGPGAMDPPEVQGVEDAEPGGPARVAVRAHPAP